MEERRRTVVDVLFKNKIWYRRSRWSDPRIEIGSGQAIDARYWRHPVGCILDETLPFCVRVVVALGGLYCGKRSVTRSGIARRHAQS